MQPVRLFLAWLAPTRVYLAAFVALALVGVLFCFFPLVNLLGYESAAAFGVIGGLAAVFLTLHAVWSGVVEPPLDRSRIDSPTADFFVLLARHTLMLLAPAALLTLNALRVVNCSYQTGVGFWLAIPVLSIAMGQLIGWAAAAITSSRRWQFAICIIVILGSAAALLAHLALQPPIVGHQLFLGYFSGSIYDEALALPMSLVWYRATNVALAAAILGLIEARWRKTVGRSRRWPLVAALVAATAFGALWIERQELGIRIDRESIQEKLGGRIETEHFVIHYPQTERFIKEVDALAEDHEFRYAEMREFFDTDPAADAKIHSYVYPDRETKGALMGGRRTLVAKLWLGEMHILWRHYGDHKLAHELAHVFTEPFGAGPLSLSMQAGVGVNMGLVEGAATAADWPVDELSPHQASAALRRMELAPDIRSIVAASGFWSQSSGRAYTLVGSFMRYLIDTHGIEDFKRAYPDGDFEEAYGVDPAELVAEWEAFLDALELTERQMELARFMYDQPAIFDKICAREIGEMRREATVAAQAGNVGKVSEIYETILEFAPQNIRHRIAYAHALREVRRYDDAIAQVEQMLAEEHPPVIRAQLLHLRGDLAWHSGDAQSARNAYRSCLELGVPFDTQRLLEVKIDALGQPIAQRELAYEYLLGQNAANISLYFPMKWYRGGDQDRLAGYLLGRRLWLAHEWGRALPYLQRAEGVEGILGDENARMLGWTHYFLGDLDRAEAVFARLAHSELPGYRAAAVEWLDRIAWKRGNRLGTN